MFLIDALGLLRRLASKLRDAVAPKRISGRVAVEDANLPLAGMAVGGGLKSGIADARAAEFAQDKELAHVPQLAITRVFADKAEARNLVCDVYNVREMGFGGVPIGRQQIGGVGVQAIRANRPV